jgi:hypothetical protein
MLNQYRLRSINPSEVFNSDKNMKSIQEDVLWDGGKFVIINGSNEPALLIGALESNDETYSDYYWIFIDHNLDLVISSCCGGYTVIDNPDDAPNLSVLKYLVDNDLDGLVERIIQKLKKMGRDEELITDIYFTEER